MSYEEGIKDAIALVKSQIQDHEALAEELANPKPGVMRPLASDQLRRKQYKEKAEALRPLILMLEGLLHVRLNSGSDSEDQQRD